MNTVLILLSVHLPKGHGKDLHGRFRSEVPTGEIRVVESRARYGAASRRRRRKLGEETEDGRRLRTVSQAMGGEEQGRNAAIYVKPFSIIVFSR